MSKVVFGALLAAAFALGLAFRVVSLDTRPMHHDEANQAVKFAALLEHGEYRYDPDDHHGPTLYYLTLLSAWARGQATLAALDERTIRVVPALFGAGLILLMSLLAGGLGRPAVLASAVLAAVSPALNYYSRFFIQESLLLFFSLAFLIALGRFVWRPSAGAAIVAGAMAGLAFATKETSVIVLAAGLLAASIARWLAGVPPARERRVVTRGRWVALALAAVAVAAVVAFVFFSSWLRHPSGPLDAVRAFGAYVDRGVGAGPHVEPWDYYVRLLAYSSSGGLVWTEGSVLAFALVGFVSAFLRGEGFWSRYLALYALIATVAFSAIPYKTPWNLLPFYGGLVVLAGIGVGAAIDAGRSRLVHIGVVAVFVAGVCHLGFASWRADGRYAADPRNPYVYAQTSPDFLGLVARVSALAAVHPDNTAMFVRVIAAPHEQWPLPWYLRRMTRVGYWMRAEDAKPLDAAPVIIASQSESPAVEAALGDRYIEESYGLRPEVLLTLYVERGLWEKFLLTRGRVPGE